MELIKVTLTALNRRAAPGVQSDKDWMGVKILPRPHDQLDAPEVLPAQLRAEDKVIQHLAPQFRHLLQAVEQATDRAEVLARPQAGQRKVQQLFAVRIPQD